MSGVPRTAPGEPDAGQTLAPPRNKAADSHEVRPLTGVRGFAACLVILHHFYPPWRLLLPGLDGLRPAAERGLLGVDLFFLLSGFVLSYVYCVGDRAFGLTEYGRFLWFRLARVYPTHLATLALMGGMVLAAKLAGVTLSGNYALSDLPTQLVLTQAWPYFECLPWNYPSWSISAEWFAYLGLFPVVWRLLRRQSVGEGVYLIVGYALLALWLYGVNEPGQLHALSRVSCEFLAGGMLFGVHRCAGRCVGLCRRYATAIFLVVVVLLCLSPAIFPPASTLVVLLFPPLLLGLTSEASLVARVLSTSPALWLGRVSYALYMTHAIVEKFVKIALPAERYAASTLVVRVGVLAADLCCVLALGITFYYLVEKPSRNLLRVVRLPWPARRAKSVV